VRIDQRLQAAPFHELHGDIKQALFFACVENDDDIGMGQEARGARLGLDRPISSSRDSPVPASDRRSVLTATSRPIIGSNP